MTEKHNKELHDMRSEIDRMDAQLIDYLKERLAYAKKIADFKAGNSLEVYDPKREQLVIKEAQRQFDETSKEKITSVISGIMRISREVQYDHLMDKDGKWDISEIIKKAGRDIPEKARICCQGTSGSYSHLTAASIYPEGLCVPALTFHECMDKLADGYTDMALLPLENTTAGTVNEVYDLLNTFPFYIVQTVTVPIHHKLVVLPGSDTYKLKTVLSHPQALSQCSRYIKQKGFAQIAVENTAFAVSRLKEIGDPSYCAIASEIAGSINNLQILDEDICDYEHNQTRFVLVSRNPIITEKANRISITFSLVHQSGSLAGVLNAFAERGLSLTKIQSRPVADRPWEYSFWADLSAPKGDREAILALYQLSKELAHLKFLGWYEEVNATL